jgi:hypothetical protein
MRYCNERVKRWLAQRDDDTHVPAEPADRLQQVDWALGRLSLADAERLALQINWLRLEIRAVAKQVRA